MSKLLRGEIWLIDLNPVRRHEQSGNRPCLLISVDLPLLEKIIFQQLVVIQSQ